MGNQYLNWYNSNKLSSQEKQSIANLTNEEKERFFADKNIGFGTAGVRDKMCLGTNGLNRFTCGQLFHAYANVLQKNNPQKIQLEVVVGHDNRINSAEFALLAAKIFNSYGIKVWLFKKNQCICTPIVSYAIRKMNCHAGLNITASHNPKEYNGIKFYSYDGAQLTSTKAIEESMCKYNEILNVKLDLPLSNTSYMDDKIIEQYFDECKNVYSDKVFINSTKKNIPVLINANQGTACKLLPKFLKQLGYKVKTIPSLNKISGKFENTKDPNPENIVSFNQPIEYANKHNIQIIIGVDPDADRMAIATKHQGNWKIFTGNETGTIFSYYLLNSQRNPYKKPFIVASYVTTNVLDLIAKDFNCPVYRTATGFKWLGSEVSKHEDDHNSLVVCCEESIGSLLLPINRDKDSFCASALILEIFYKCLSKNITLVDYLDNIYKKYGYCKAITSSYTIKDINFKPIVANKIKKILAVKAGKAIGKSFKVTKVQWNEDGGCVEWTLNNNSWIKYRASGTEPKIKSYINVYGKDAKDVNEKYDDVKKCVDEIIETY